MRMGPATTWFPLPLIPVIEEAPRRPRRPKMLLDRHVLFRSRCVWGAAVSAALRCAERATPNESTHLAAAMQSISTRALRTRPAEPNVVRAGFSVGKNVR